MRLCIREIKLRLASHYGPCEDYDSLIYVRQA